MITRISKRLTSFKDAGLKYIHDKAGKLYESIEWTHTLNMVVNQPKTSMKYMAYIVNSSTKLKIEAGISLAGRKATRGSVYTFSLSWHPEETPNKLEMIEAASETIEILGLEDYQAIVIAYQKTTNQHIRIICNLVNPYNGRTKVISHDRRKLSKWAAEYEEKNGKIYCQRWNGKV